MNYIQCGSEDEVETTLAGIKDFKAAFVTEDFRIYSSIKIVDEFSTMEFPASTTLCLLDLQTSLEIKDAFNHEMRFRDVASFAKDLQDAYLKACEAIKFKPITKEKI